MGYSFFGEWLGMCIQRRRRYREWFKKLKKAYYYVIYYEDSVDICKTELLSVATRVGFYEEYYRIQILSDSNIMKVYWNKTSTSQILAWLLRHNFSCQCTKKLRRKIDLVIALLWNFLKYRKIDALWGVVESLYLDIWNFIIQNLQ